MMLDFERVRIYEMIPWKQGNISTTLTWGGLHSHQHAFFPEILARLGNSVNDAAMKFNTVVQSFPKKKKKLKPSTDLKNMIIGYSNGNLLQFAFWWGEKSKDMNQFVTFVTFC